MISISCGKILWFFLLSPFTIYVIIAPRLEPNVRDSVKTPQSCNNKAILVRVTIASLPHKRRGEPCLTASSTSMDCTCITIQLYNAPTRNQHFPHHETGKNISVAGDLLFPLLTSSQKKKGCMKETQLLLGKMTSNSTSSDQTR